MDRRGFLKCVAAGGALIAGGVSAPAVQAQAPTRMKMVLNWKYQGPQGWFFLAEDRGYFKAEGVDIVIDQGEGSSASIIKVAAGAYDVGFGDINSLIQLAASKPEEAPVGVYMMYNTPPFAVAVKADSPLKTPKDFEGKTLGGAANDGALKLFPALAKLAGFDASKVNIINMAPNLREQMLMRGQVDGVFGYVNTIHFSAKSAGIDADKALRYIRYSDYGMDLYSNVIVVSKKLIRDNPSAVKGLVRAINRGLLDALKDPEAAVAAVVKREPLINAKVERERFDATLAMEMNGPELASVGIGDVVDARLKRAIEIVADADKLPRTPALEEIFNRSFLPPLADRPTKVIG